jgi:hypothetical protein
MLKAGAKLLLVTKDSKSVLDYAKTEDIKKVILDQAKIRAAEAAKQNAKASSSSSSSSSRRS